MKREPKKPVEAYTTPDDRGQDKPAPPLSPRDRTDLEWYYRDSAGDMGAKSVHTALLASKERGSAVGSGVPETWPTPQVRTAAERHRRIYAVLGSLSRLHQGALRDVLTEETTPAVRRKLAALEDYAALAVSIRGSVQAVERTCLAAAHGTREAGKPLQDLIAECEQRFGEAARAYTEACRESGRHERTVREERLEHLRARLGL